MFAAIPLAVLAGLGVWLLKGPEAAVRHARAQSPSAEKPQHRPPQRAAPAATQPAAGAQSSAITLPATLDAEESVDLYAKASGYVSEIAVDIGSRVRNGDVLIQIDTPEMHDDIRQNEAVIAVRSARIEAMKAKAAQARLAVELALAQHKRVEAELGLSRITHTRKSELYREKAIPQQELDVAENQLAINEADLAIAKARIESARGEELAAQADVKAAEADLVVARSEAARLKTLLGYTTVKAPFDGVITRRDVDRGAFVRSAAQGAGLPLLALARVDRLRLVLDVPEVHAPVIRPGTEVRIQVRASGQQLLTGEVARIASALRADTRTMRAEVDLDNDDGALMPGMYARALIQLPAKSEPGI